MFLNYLEVVSEDALMLHVFVSITKGADLQSQPWAVQEQKRPHLPRQRLPPTRDQNRLAEEWTGNS